MNFLFKKILHIFYVLILGIFFIISVEPFTPQTRVGHSSILVGTKLYFFGGYADEFVGALTIHCLNDMIILDTSDTVNLVWSYGSTFNAPNNRTGYTATMLKNSVIVYIGGAELIA